MYILALSLVVFGFMLVEAVRAARNERAQRARGGREPEGDVYAIMRLAYPGAFLAMLAEGAVRGAPPAAAIGAGLAVFVLAKGLKWWAIVSLGPAWTFRVVIVPGAPLVTSGPYRWMRHPNYIAIVGELMSVAVLTGAVVAGPLVTLAFGALVAKRIAVETRALDAILPRR